MIRIECISADPRHPGRVTNIKNFNSYAFDRNILTPAAAFRLTAPGVDKADRKAIRSGDTIRLFVENSKGHTAIVGVGFVDETDTHGTASSVEYVISGRDTIGQLVDNAAVDENNKIILFEKSNLDVVVNSLLKNTRMSKNFRCNQLDRNRDLAVSTNLGETRINVLQRSLEYLGGLVWANNNGEAVIDKPNFTQAPSGRLTCKYSDPKLNNVLEYRVKRNLNQAIRKIVTQQNGTEAASQTYETIFNMDQSIKPYKDTGVGKSVSELFSYASGTDIINQATGVGHGQLDAHTLSREYSARQIARENMRILDVEIIVEGHFNEVGYLYNIDQIYQVNIEDEDVNEPLYVYGVSYELTLDHGMMTRLHLCRKWTICAYADQFARVIST